jgi:hypothetical protein
MNIIHNILDKKLIIVIKAKIYIFEKKISEKLEIIIVYNLRYKNLKLVISFKS